MTRSYAIYSVAYSLSRIKKFLTFRLYVNTLHTQILDTKNSLYSPVFFLTTMLSFAVYISWEKETEWIFYADFCVTCVMSTPGAELFLYAENWPLHI